MNSTHLHVRNRSPLNASGFSNYMKSVSSCVSCTLSLSLIAITSLIWQFAFYDTKERCHLSEAPGEQKRNSQEDQYDCCLRGSRPQAAGIDVAIKHRKHQFSIPKGGLCRCLQPFFWRTDVEIIRVRETDKTPAFTKPWNL